MNMSCDLTKERLIRYLMVIKIMVLRKNSWKEILASSRLLCFLLSLQISRRMRRKIILKKGENSL